MLLLLSIALSGWAMWLLRAHLTGSASAGDARRHRVRVRAVPLRSLSSPRAAGHDLPAADAVFRAGASTRAIGATCGAADACVVAQVYCGIYYAVFLVTALARSSIPLQLSARCRPSGARRSFARAFRPLAVAALVVAPYLAAYVLNRDIARRAIRSRRAQLYSATLGELPGHDSTANVIHGGWSAQLGQPERRLFPGVMAFVLAGVGLLAIDRRRVDAVVHRR